MRPYPNKHIYMQELYTAKDFRVRHWQQTDEKILFQEKTTLTVSLALGILVLLFASLNLLPFLNGHSPSTDSWLKFIMLASVGVAFLLHSTFTLLLTDTALITRHGFRTYRYPFESFSEALYISRPNFDYSSRGGPCRLDLPRSPKPVSIVARHDVYTPWSSSDHSIALLFKKPYTPYLIQHPQAKRLAQIISEHMSSSK